MLITSYQQDTKLAHKRNIDGIRLKEHRRRAGLSQCELARIAGTSQPQINRLENGHRAMDKNWLKRLSSALNINPEDLIENTNSIKAIFPACNDNIHSYDALLEMSRFMK